MRFCQTISTRVYRVSALAALMLVLAQVSYACCPYTNETTISSIDYSESHQAYLVHETQSSSAAGLMYEKWEYLDDKFDSIGFISYAGEERLGSSIKEGHSLSSELPKGQLELDKQHADNELAERQANYGRPVTLDQFNSQLGFMPLPRTKNPLKVSKNKKGVLLADAETNNDFMVDAFEHGVSTGAAFHTNHGKIIGLIRETEHTGYCSSASTDKYLVIDPDNFAYLRENIYGYRAILKKDYRTAKWHLEKSLALNRSYHHANFNMACVLSLLAVPFKEGYKYLDTIFADEDRLDQYLKKVQADPDLENWRREPAFVPWLERRKNQAATLKREEAKRVTKTASFVEAGLAAYQKGDFKGARDQFIEARRLSPNNVNIKLSLASVYSSLGVGGSAIELLKESMSSNPRLTIKRMRTDTGFESMREDLEFQNILDEAESKIETE